MKRPPTPAQQYLTAMPGVNRLKDSPLWPIAMAFDSATWSRAPVQRIPISTLHRTQRTCSRHVHPHVRTATLSPMASRLDCPDHYDDDHRAVWADAVRRLTSNGRVFRADPEVLAVYVEAVISHRQASRILAQEDVTHQRGDGTYAENPSLGIQQRCADALTRASRTLGLDRIPADPIAGPVPAAPIADETRWCDQHQRRECKHNRADGQPCHQFKLVSGTSTCRKHGGKTLEQLRADGQQRVIEEQARRELARLDVEPVTNPLTELAVLAGQCVAWKNAMAAKVNALTSIRYEGGPGVEQLRAEIAVWERALDRCLMALTAMAKLNIEQRLAGVRAATVQMLDEALSMALAKSGADVSGQAAAREEFKKRLKVVA